MAAPFCRFRARVVFLRAVSHSRGDSLAAHPKRASFSARHLLGPTLLLLSASATAQTGGPIGGPVGAPAAARASYSTRVWV